MKVFASGLAVETNTFCPRLTSKKDFSDKYIARSNGQSGAIRALAVPLSVFAERAKNKGWIYSEGLFAAAPPSGVIIKKDYEELRDMMLNDLQQALPVDMVLLNLHGAMVAQDYDDCEGDMLSHVRSIVGKNIPIGVLLDPHANLSNKMLEYADVLICYKEYPHTDIQESAEDLFTIMENMYEGKIHPCMSAFDCQVINSYPTTLEPMKSYLDNVKILEKQKDVISISIVHGFPWSDVADVGSKIIVITNDKQDLANQLAKELGKKLFDLRDKTMPKFYSIDEALTLALESNSFPVVLADFADNTGGGAPGDSTFILKRLVELDIKNVALGILWDPIAVDIAAAAGIGSKLSLRIGGKIGPQSGDPVDLMVTVTSIDPNLFVNFGGGIVRYGQAVTVSTNNIDIVLSSLRLQVYSTECFSKMGIDPKKKSILVVKSSEHFRDSFSKISNNIISVNTSGALCPDFSTIKYKNIDRQLWPIYKLTKLEN